MDPNAKVKDLCRMPNDLRKCAIYCTKRTLSDVSERILSAAFNVFDGAFLASSNGESRTTDTRLGLGFVGATKVGHDDTTASASEGAADASSALALAARLLLPTMIPLIQD